MSVVNINNKQFEKIWNRSTIGFAIIDRDEKIIKVNPMLCEMLQYSESELIGKQISDITHPADMDNDQAMIDQVLSGNISEYRMTKRYITKTGPSVWATLVVTALEDHLGQFQFFFSQVFPVPAPVATSVSVDIDSTFPPSFSALPKETTWGKTKAWVFRNLAWIVASVVALSIWSVNEIHNYRMAQTRIEVLEQKLEKDQSRWETLMDEWVDFQNKIRDAR